MIAYGTIKKNTFLLQSECIVLCDFRFFNAFINLLSIYPYLWTEHIDKLNSNSFCKFKYFQNLIF